MVGKKICDNPTTSNNYQMRAWNKRFENYPTVNWGKFRRWGRVHDCKYRISQHLFLDTRLDSASVRLTVPMHFEFSHPCGLIWIAWCIHEALQNINRDSLYPSYVYVTVKYTLYNVILHIARNLLENREDIKYLTHPFYHTNLDWFS